MEKITAKIQIFFYICLLLFFRTNSVSSQEFDGYDTSSDTAVSEFIFHITVEDDISNDIPEIEPMFGREYEVIDMYDRYESTKFQFGILPIGDRTRIGEVDVPDEIFDVFGKDAPGRRSRAGRKGSSFTKEDLKVSLETSFYFHHKNSYMKSNFKIADSKFKNSLRLDYNTDGYCIVDSFEYEIDSRFSVFNHLWSFADSQRLLFDDAFGLRYSHNWVQYSYSAYGGYDVYNGSPLAGTGFFVKFTNFDMGGYVGYRKKQFNLGSKFNYTYEFVNLNGYFDFLTNFTNRVVFQPDFSAEFSIFPVSFGFFKLSDTYDTRLFNEVSEKIKVINYNNQKIKSVAGGKLFADLSPIGLSVLTSFYSADKDFLSVDESLAWINPIFYGDLGLTVDNDKFRLYFGNNINVKFDPNVSFGTTVGVYDISVKYILMGFFADFEVENNCADYRLAVRTEILSDFACNLTFFIKTFNEFYLNRLSIDFYIQAGFRSIL